MSFSFKKLKGEECWLFPLDSYLTSQKGTQTRADAVFITKSISSLVKIIIVELKGADLKKAIEQIESTITMFSNNSNIHKQIHACFDTLQKHAIITAHIVHKNGRSMPLYKAKLRFIEKKHNVRIFCHEKTYSADNIATL